MMTQSKHNVNTSKTIHSTYNVGAEHSTRILAATAAIAQNPGPTHQNGPSSLAGCGSSSNRPNVVVAIADKEHKGTGKKPSTSYKIFYIS